MNRRGFMRTAAVVGMPLLVLKAKAVLSDTSSIGASLNELIPALMREANVPGLSISVIERGRVAWRGAFGVRDNATKELVTDETLFEAASVSKTVFAYAVLQLCDRGILDLDRPLVKYGVPPLRTGDSRMDKITARHVLSHSSGFQDFRSRKEPLKIHFEPGTKFLYSGEGYYYLQTVVTRLTGQVDEKLFARYEAGLEVCGSDFDAYMKRTLLRPLGMTTSGYLWDDALKKHAAQPHNTNGTPSAKKQPRTPDVARYGACGGLHTTASEYARFLLDVINPTASDTVRLHEAMRQQMLRPQIRLAEDQHVDGANSWALGWGIQQRNGGKVIVHSGGQAGFQSLTMASLDRKSGFVVLTNSDNGWKIFQHQRFSTIIDRLLGVRAA